MKRTLMLLAGIAVAGLALAACGEKTDTLSAVRAPAQPLSLMLDRSPEADHVGVYRALAEGGFAQAGLNVRVEVPADPATPLQLLAAGKIAVAVSSEPQLLLARDRGAPLVAIGAIVQRPLSSILSLGDQHITTAAQLRGQRVGDAGKADQHAYLTAILKWAKVPPQSVKEIDVGDTPVKAMLSGQVNATLGGYWNNEAIQLRQLGRRVNVIHVEAAGVPNYDELVLVTREDEIANRNNVLRRFVQALGRGYDSVRADPQAGVSSLVTADPSLALKLQLASVGVTLSSFFPSDPGLPWGWQDQKQWIAFGEWMLGHHLISHPGTFVDAATNQLLAGQGP